MHRDFFYEVVRAFNSLPNEHVTTGTPVPWVSGAWTTSSTN